MDGPERLKDFSKKYGITYPQWRDPQMKALKKLTIQGVIPRTVVLDRKHKIVLRELGYTKSKFQHVVLAVEKAVKGTQPKSLSRPSKTKKPASTSTLSYSVAKTETLASKGSVGFFTTVTVGAKGRPVVACKDYGRGALLVMTWSGRAWKSTYVDSKEAGWSPSVGFSPQGRLGVSYGGGNSDFEIRFARYDGKEWKVEVVDDQGKAFKATSLAYTAAGDPMISYFAKENQDLRLARWNSSQKKWLVETVDSKGDVGTYTSLQLDKNGHPMISYFDEGKQDLKFARWDGRKWNIRAIDTEGQVGLHCSLSVDHAGHPAITYFDLTNESLKFARWTGKKWSFSTIDSEGTVGQRCSLVFDSRGNPAVSYFGNGTLKFAYGAKEGWEILTVDSGGLTGNYTSLALDSQDNGRISYFDVSNADLKFAWVDRLKN